jgi:hypothetical protein
MPEWQGEREEYQTGIASRRPNNTPGNGRGETRKILQQNISVSQEVRASQGPVTLRAGIGGLLKSQPTMLPKTMLNPKVSRKCA